MSWESEVGRIISNKDFEFAAQELESVAKEFRDSQIDVLRALLENLTAKMNELESRASACRFLINALEMQNKKGDK